VKIQSSNSEMVYDDPVTGTKRKIGKNEIVWVQPSANLPSQHYTVLDPEDGYGKRTRRVLVGVADLAAEPALYNPGCVGQPKYIDEFVGVGDTQSLSGMFFKRSKFIYEDVQNPTKWTAITETEHLEP